MPRLEELEFKQLNPEINDPPLSEFDRSLSGREKSSFSLISVSRDCADDTNDKITRV